MWESTRSVGIVDAVAVSLAPDVFLHLLKLSLFLRELTLCRFVLRFQVSPPVAPVFVIRRVIRGSPARLCFIILGEPGAPRGKLVLETRDVVLDIDDLALLYSHLILEFFALRFELLYRLLILFFVGGLVAGGLRGGGVRRWHRLGRRRIAAIA